MLGVWRAPERLAASAIWRGGALIDVPVFGEIGLIATRRGADGKPAPIPSGRLVLPRGAPQGIHVLNVARTPAARSRSPARWCRTPPSRPARSAAAAPRLKITEGSIDTGYACRLDRDTKMITIDGPPAGIVSVGGYRFALRAAQDLVAGIEDGSTLAALPDLVAGHRLAGAGADRDAICDALLAHGANPLAGRGIPRPKFVTARIGRLIRSGKSAKAR